MQRITLIVFIKCNWKHFFLILEYLNGYLSNENGTLKNYGLFRLMALSSIYT